MYRRWTYLVLGAALMVPFVLITTLVMPLLLSALLPPDAAKAPLVVIVAVTVSVLGLAMVTSFIPAVRVVEGTAARELLGDEVPDQALLRATNWEARWRTSAWFVLHVVAGAVVGVLTLVLPVVAVQSFATPFTGRWLTVDRVLLTTPVGWHAAWVPLVSLLSVFALVHFVNGLGVVMTRLAPILLGATPADMLVELRRRTDQLAERNRLARELHDSVGHALSVVTIQASAAGRVLDSDPDFAHRALSAIEESARRALVDLDHVLGLLRDDASATTTQRTMVDLDSLLNTMRLAGVDVAARVGGELHRLPLVVSREAYRIVQECLTNALRHAGKVQVELTVVVSDEALEVRAVNPLGQAAPARRRGGRGIPGMRERVNVLRGRIEVGAVKGTWRVCARIPLRAGKVS
jgi:signal transduction histidine kinase